MEIGIADAIILLLLALGGLVGFKKGFITEITSFIGLFVVVIVAFYLKNPLSVILYENLPFITFGGIISGLDVLNIIFYEIIAFLIVLAVLIFVLRVLLVITGLVEKLVKMTIFLSLPSKILGLVVGIVEAYVYVFLALFILNLPVFKIDIIQESKGANIILNNTPILSGYVADLVETSTEIYEVINDKSDDNMYMNEKVLVILLDNKIVTIDSADKLIKANKVQLRKENFIEEYKSGKLDLDSTNNSEEKENANSVNSITDTIKNNVKSLIG